MDGASTTTLNGRNYLTTSGDKAHGIEVYAAASSKGSEEKAAQVKVGSDSTVYTQGNQSHGVYTDMLDAEISLGDDISVTTKGSGSHGIYASRGVIETGDGLRLSAQEQVLMLPMPTLPTAVSNLTAELISVQQIRTVMLFMLIRVGK